MSRPVDGRLLLVCFRFNIPVLFRGRCEKVTFPKTEGGDVGKDGLAMSL